MFYIYEDTLDWGRYPVSSDEISGSVLRCFKVKTVFTTGPSFQSFQKLTLPILQQNKIVYKSQSQRDVDYIDRIIQRLEVRIKQHIHGNY